MPALAAVEQRESPLVIIISGVALLMLLNLAALLAKRATRKRPQSTTAISSELKTEVQQETLPKAVAEAPGPDGGKSHVQDNHNHANDTPPIPSNANDTGERDVSAGQELHCRPPPELGPPKPERLFLDSAANNNNNNHKTRDTPRPTTPDCSFEKPLKREEQKPPMYPLRSVGTAAWQASHPAVPPRARLGPLPSRRPYGAGGQLKQPRGLASCVIREDMPYPPANAEVTFEIRTTTVRHGRKLLRYAASSPLDTIYIKIPNTHPASLHPSILESLRHTIDLGQQRIVVGGGVRPGCTLLVMDLLAVLEEEHVPAVGGASDGAPGTAPPEERAASEGVRRLLSGPSGGRTPDVREDAGGGGSTAAASSSWRSALGLLLSTTNGNHGGRRDGGAGAGGGGLLREGGGAEGDGLADAAALVGSGLSRWFKDMGVATAEGLRLQLQQGSTLLEAEYLGGKEQSWAFRRLTQAAEVAAAAAPAPAATRTGGVSLVLLQQVLVAPAVVGEAVKISVRVRGLPELGVGGEGTADMGRSEPYMFVVRGLGRHLPLLAVSAPTTPSLDSACSVDSGGGVVHSYGMSSDDDTGDLSGLSGGSPGSALVAAVVAAAAVGGKGGDAAAAAASVTASGPSADSVYRIAAARDDVSVVALELLQPPDRSSPQSALGRTTSVGWQGADSNGRDATAIPPVALAAHTAAAAESVSQFELTVAGLGPNRRCGGGASGPILLQVEVWQDNRHLLASKPVLLLPPQMSELAAELQRLVRMQQELQEEEEATAAAAATAGRGDQRDLGQMGNAAAAAPTAVAPAAGCEGTAATGRVHSLEGSLPGGDGPSSADQLVSDLGLWMEFVYDSLSVAASEAAVAEAADVTAAAAGAAEQARGRGGGGAVAGVDQSRGGRMIRHHSDPEGEGLAGYGECGAGVVLTGSLDLRGDVLRQRRRQPAFSTVMLRSGLGLLEAAASYGSAPLVHRLLGDLASLGYGAAEVWAATGADAAAGSLLHLAAASGDAATLRTVTELAEVAGSSRNGDGGGGGDCWLLPDGEGHTPLHLLAVTAADAVVRSQSWPLTAASDADAATAALGWALQSAGEVPRRAWREARDGDGLTPVDILAEALQYISTATEGTAGDGSGSAERAPGPYAGLSKLLEQYGTVPYQRIPPQLPAAVAAGPSRGLLPRAEHGGSIQNYWDGNRRLNGSRLSNGSQGVVNETEVPKGACVAVADQPDGSAAAVAAGSHSWQTRCRRRVAATASVLWATLAGFGDGPGTCGGGGDQDGAGYSGGGGSSSNSACDSGVSGMEARYQSYVTRRTLKLAQWWVSLHLLLNASAVGRLLADRRSHEVAAPLLYSSGHMMMLVVLVLLGERGCRLYLPRRGAWWAAAASLRTSSKVIQLAGWVALPVSTLRFVKKGATLVSDGVLPALFEPCPLPYAMPILVYDFVVSTVLYLRIGYTASLPTALLRAAFKCGVSLTLRMAVDLMQRAAFVRSRSAQGDPAAAKGHAGTAGAAAAAAAGHATRVRGYLGKEQRGLMGM